MKTEHLLTAGFCCAAAISSVWAVQLYVAGPQYPEGLAFSEYSTIDHPLYRPPDMVRIEPDTFDGELITGSLPKRGNPTQSRRTSTSTYDIVGIYDQMAVVKNKQGKIWTLSEGSDLPEVGIVLKIEATEKHWILTGTHGVVATARAARN